MRVGETIPPLPSPPVFFSSVLRLGDCEFDYYFFHIFFSRTVSALCVYVLLGAGSIARFPLSIFYPNRHSFRINTHLTRVFIITTETVNNTPYAMLAGLSCVLSFVLHPLHLTSLLYPPSQLPSRLARRHHRCHPDAFTYRADLLVFLTCCEVVVTCIKTASTIFRADVIMLRQDRQT